MSSRLAHAVLLLKGVARLQCLGRWEAADPIQKAQPRSEVFCRAGFFLGVFVALFTGFVHFLYGKQPKNEAF